MPGGLQPTARKKRGRSCSTSIRRWRRFCPLTGKLLVGLRLLGHASKRHELRLRQHGLGLRHDRVVAHREQIDLPGGGFGVDMFFVLSGFLITTLLLEEIDDKGRINVLFFYARRLLRLYPALLFLLLLGLLPSTILISALIVATFGALFTSGGFLLGTATHHRLA